MLTTDLTELQPGTEFPEQLSTLSHITSVLPLSSTGHGKHAPAPEDVASCHAAAQAWAAESRLSMPEFRRVYLERCVAELLDQHPAWLRVDAERLVLSEATWLDDCAA
jgi:hypothetical protein